MMLKFNLYLLQVLAKVRAYIPSQHMAVTTLGEEHVLQLPADMFNLLASIYRNHLSVITAQKTFQKLEKMWVLHLILLILSHLFSSSCLEKNFTVLSDVSSPARIELTVSNVDTAFEFLDHFIEDGGLSVFAHTAAKPVLSGISVFIKLVSTELMRIFSFWVHSKTVPSDSRTSIHLEYDPMCNAAVLYALVLQQLLVFISSGDTLCE
jgi:hypothetical protein